MGVTQNGEVAAHKHLLKARSPVFRAMFDSNMKEASLLRILVEDVDMTTMRRFLHFVYTAEFPSEMIEGEHSVEGWGRLASVGDKYDVRSLVDACVHHLKLWVDGETVLNNLAIADKLGHQSFKQFCLEYATKDKETLRLAQDSPFFETLSAGLVRELFVNHAGSHKRKRDDAFEFPDGTDWQRLTYVQLQRACDERGLPVLGDKGELLAKLRPRSKDSEEEKV